MTKTLTEQWREGKLPDGYYYVTSKKWGMLIDRFKDQINDCGDEWRGFDNCQGIVDEVLAPVPSYDHFSQLVKKVERLQKQLTIATKALKGISVWANTGNGGEKAVKKVCEKALKEMEGVK